MSDPDAVIRDLRKLLDKEVPNMPSGWLTFDRFFARQLDGGLRPVTEPAGNPVITSRSDHEEV